jgi:hypothetical protein
LELSKEDREQIFEDPTEAAQPHTPQNGSRWVSRVFFYLAFEVFPMSQIFTRSLSRQKRIFSLFLCFFVPLKDGREKNNTNTHMRRFHFFFLRVRWFILKMRRKGIEIRYGEKPHGSTL